MRRQDAAAALGTWGVELTILGSTYDIPTLSAADWFLAVLDPDPLAVVPGLLPEPAQLEVLEAVALGDLDTEALETLARDALEAVSGLRWWEADRLIRGASADMLVFGGELARCGIDLAKVGLGQALGTIYVMAARTMKEDERAMFDSQLSAPPEDVAPEEAFDAQVAQQAFIAALGMPPA